MGTSPETFAQVKNILRKLDQSIDAARNRRLATPAPSAKANGTHAPQRLPEPPPNPNRARPMAPRVDPPLFSANPRPA